MHALRKTHAVSHLFAVLSTVGSVWLTKINGRGIVERCPQDEIEWCVAGVYL